MSELAKFALILDTQVSLRRGHTGIAHFKIYFYLLPIWLFRCFLWFQPDMNSAYSFRNLVCYLLVCGINGSIFGGCGYFSAIFCFYVEWFFGNYQKDRISALFHPERDPLGVNYSVIQSKIAIGSAGFLARVLSRERNHSFGFCRKLRRILFSSFTENGDCWER